MVFYCSLLFHSYYFIFVVVEVLVRRVAADIAMAVAMCLFGLCGSPNGT